MGDDLVLDAVIGGLRNNMTGHQVALGVVGTAVDDLLRIGLTDTL